MIRASEIYPTRLCSGRVAAQKGLPDATTDSAEEGNIVHATLHDPVKFSALGESQMKIIAIVQKMIRVREVILAKIFVGVTNIQIIKEQEFHISIAGESIISCHPDFVAIGVVDGKRIAVIVDYKTGWLSDEVQPPEINDQLRAYSIAVYQHFLVDEVYSTIIPRSGKMIPPVVYGREEIGQAILDLSSVEHASRINSHIRTPSPEACRYCKARATTRCPETLREMDIQVSHNVLPEQLLPTDIALWIEKAHASIASAKKFLERVEKLVTDNPDAVPGYAMMPGQKVRTIGDATKAFNAVCHLLTPEKEAEEFSSIVSIGVTDIEELIVKKLRTADPKLKVKYAQQKANDLLSEVIVWKQNKPSLKAVKQLENT